MEIIKSRKDKKLLILIYGKDGVGKSSLAAQFPSPLFIGPEDGASYLDVSRFDKEINSWESFSEVIDYTLNNIQKIKNETIVIDSLDWIEPLIHSFICKKYRVDNLALAAKGFGAGYKEAFDMQVELKNKLNIIGKHKHLVLVAHSQIKTFNDPQTESPYDRYELKLHESGSVSARALWREFVDAMFFIKKETYTVGSDKSSRAHEGELFLYTSGTPAFDAKRRVQMPDKILFKEAGMFEEIRSYFLNKEDIGILYARVLEIAKKVRDEELRNSVLSKLPKYKNDYKKLKEIEKFIEGK